MYRFSSVFVLLASLAAQQLHGQTVIWEYDLTELPEGWTDEYPWEFSTDGMNFYYYDCWSLDTDGNVNTAYFDIPENTDSLTLSIESIYQASSYGGSHEAEIYYRTNRIGSTWNRVWIVSGIGTWSGTINVTIPESSSATAGKFRFRGNAESGASSSYAYLDWTLYDLVLTAHISPLALSGITWASIKTSF